MEFRIKIRIITAESNCNLKIEFDSESCIRLENALFNT